VNQPPSTGLCLTTRRQGTTWFCLSADLLGNLNLG
jgi:hypothetical protein